jgi:hypothetical protein
MWCRCDIPVNIEGDEANSINLKISVSIPLEPANRKRNYSLLWLNNPVRKLHINGSHTNRRGTKEKWVRRTHKHSWDDETLGAEAYTPTDITATEYQGEFRQFCNECGINCLAELPPLPEIQGGVFDDL